tara:strand:- start:485 stop:694 length:210 start_codon:yes stop_codon:yes gene_type:complete
VHLPRELLVSELTKIVYRSTSVTPRGSQKKLKGYKFTIEWHGRYVGSLENEILLTLAREMIAYCYDFSV